MANRKTMSGKSSRSTRASRTSTVATRSKTARANKRMRSRSTKASSGRPGGGAGRRERVGGSGVYPASGPLPPDNAPMRTMAAWGQGERGAQGYQDSGSSELYITPPDSAGRRRAKRTGTNRRQATRSNK